MSDFIKFCNKISPLNQGATIDLLTTLKTKTYQKGGLILKDGAVCKHLYFINQGLVKTFFYKDDKEFIMRFFSENVMFSILESYLTQTPSRFMIKALETSMERMLFWKNFTSIISPIVYYVPWVYLAAIVLMILYFQTPTEKTKLKKRLKWAGVF